MKPVKWQLLPAGNLCIVLLNGLPQLQYGSDLRFQLFKFGEFGDGKGKGDLAPYDCADLYLCVMDSLFEFLHHSDPLVDLGTFPDIRLFWVLFRRFAYEFLDVLTGLGSCLI